jgi:hypothetical protein
MTDYNGISSELYADRLCLLIRGDFITDPVRFEFVETWLELAGVCDANEYFTALNLYYQIEWPENPSPQYWDFINEAVAIASERLPSEQRIAAECRIYFTENPIIQEGTPWERPE